MGGIERERERERKLPAAGATSRVRTIARAIRGAELHRLWLAGKILRGFDGCSSQALLFKLFDKAVELCKCNLPVAILVCLSDELIDHVVVKVLPNGHKNVGNVTGAKKAVVINVKLLKGELDVLFSEILTAPRATWDSCYCCIENCKKHEHQPS